LVNCSAYENIGAQAEYSANLKYIISEDKPQDEPFLMWIKNGKSDIVNNIPIIYNAPNIQKDNNKDSALKNSNIYIKPVDIQICLGDYRWRRPWEAYIINEDQTIQILQHNMIGKLTEKVEKKENDILP
jgi:hypothetical protein